MATTEIPPTLEFLLNHDTEVIELILKNLYLKDLANAGMVCKTWNVVANKLKKPSTVQMVTNNYNDVKSDHYFQNGKASPDDIKPIFTLTFIDFGVYDRYWYYLEETNGGRKGLNKIPKYKKSNVHYKFKEILPENCTSMLIQRPSVLMSYYDCTPNPRERLLGYVSLGFPDIPGVKIQSFEIDSDEKKTDIIEKANIDFSLPIKHVFLFLNNKAESCETRGKKIISHIESNQSTPFTQSVYLIDALYHSQDCKYETDYIKGIIFSGENLYTNTIYIPQVQSCKEAISELKKSMTNTCFRHNSFAMLFGFNPNIKWADMIEQYKLEFPNTVLVAVSCEKSISHNSGVVGDDFGATLQVISWC